jgi:hypothetical protein
MKINWSALWSAFRKFLICIGGIAIPAYFTNLSALPFVFSALWLILIIAVLYGIEVGKAHAWKQKWDDPPESFGPRVKP